MNPYGIGDVLFTTPLVANLRLCWPQAKIAYLANRRTADFLRSQPGIHQVLVYERDEFAGHFSKYIELWQNIRQQGFDGVFDFSLNSGLGFLCAASGIRRRIGFDYRKRGKFLTDRLDLAGYEGRHVIEYYLDLLRLIDVPVQTNRMTLDIPAQELQWAKDWIKKQAIDPAKPLIAVLPGGGASWGQSAGLKRWGASKYAHLIDKIVENFDAAVILMGDPKERELCREVAGETNFPVYFAVGETSVLGMAALLTQCRAAILNDGGPLHVAVAVGVRTISIFGPVDPAVYGPYPVADHLVVRKNLPCQPCYRRFRMARCGHINCLGELSVDDVYRKVQGIL